MEVVCMLRVAAELIYFIIRDISHGPHRSPELAV